MSRASQATNKTKKRSVVQAKQPLRFVILDSEPKWLNKLNDDDTSVCLTPISVLKALERIDANSLWISRRSKQTEGLAKTIVELISQTSQHRMTFGRLLTLEDARADVRPTLEGFFSQVIGLPRNSKKLHEEELATVLRASPSERSNVFISGLVNLDLGTLALLRGDLSHVTVPLKMFRPSGRAIPDFKRFELTDYGHTLKFGDYEATADIVLWEADSEYRKKVKVNEREQAKGFGPSLRRLRKQQGLTQADFPNVSRKSIIRIENGDIDKPHGITLNRIAKALGVEPNEIESY